MDASHAIADNPEVEFNIVETVVTGTPPTSVLPREFFIAWSGVATLAYHGLSATLVALKAQMTQALPGLKPENPGSKWPKTTLGALHDDRTLSRQDALTLLDICRAMRSQVREQAEPIAIDELSCVTFLWRSLERRLLTHRIPLAGEPSPPDDAPPPDHLLEVEETLAQFTHANLDAYLPRLRNKGNRVGDYRSTRIEATLVFDLDGWQPEYVQDFIKRVDEALPGYYAWFAPSSWHMTVRSLVSG